MLDSFLPLRKPTLVPTTLVPELVMLLSYPNAGLKSPLERSARSHDDSLAISYLPNIGLSCFVTA